MRSRPIGDAEWLEGLRVADDAVLVGGQALAFWLAYFDLPLPRGPRTYLSNDVDFLGTRRHVGVFAEALHGRAEYPARRQLSALHGAVVKNTPDGPRIQVDVLRSVVGLEADDVRRRAVAVSPPTEPTIRFLVMNPVDCLISRFENLRQLADKRDDVGVWQAGVGISVCRAYLEKLLALEQERAAIKAGTRVLRLAGSAAGVQAFRNHALDSLEAIPIERFPAAFRTKQYEKMAARVRLLRAATGAARRIR